MSGPSQKVPRSRVTLYPDDPILGGQTRGEREEESLVTWGGMTPSPVSYLPTNSKHEARGRATSETLYVHGAGAYGKEGNAEIHMEEGGEMAAQ